MINYQRHILTHIGSPDRKISSMNGHTPLKFAEPL
jgi:hypothetical protein